MCLFTRFACGAGASPATRTRVSDPHGLIWNHPLNFWRIGFADERRGPQVLLTLFLFRRQDVAQKSL